MVRQSLSKQKRPLAKLVSGREVLPTPGIYILYNTNFGPPRYVGGTGQSLFDALLQHKKSAKYRYYRFMNCRSAEEAFKWECIYWHKAHATIDNSLERGGHHPEPPHGKDWACPMPGCDWEPAWKSKVRAFEESLEPVEIPTNLE